MRPMRRIALILLALLPALAIAGGVAYCGATRVAMLGDSITNSNGMAEGQKLPDRLKLALGTLWMVDQFGIPGDSATGCNTRQTNELRPPRTTGLLPEYTYIIVLCGINDLNLGGASAATLWGRIQTIADSINAAGIAARPILLTLLPYGNSAGWTSGEQTILESVNASILAYCASNPGVVLCFDAYTVMGDTDPKDLKAAYDFGDGLHLSLDGQDALSAALAAYLVTHP